MDSATMMPARHKLDVGKYFRMAAAGVFAKEERIELIEGDLLDMAPIGPDHEAYMMGLNEAFVLACAGRFLVSPQNSLRLSQFSAPQPDLMVLRRRDDRYRTGGRPGPADVVLLVEISDSSLRFDRTVKLPLYAQAGIAELWIVDLQRNLIEVHTKPLGPTYAEMTTYEPGERIALTLAPDIIVALDPIFAAL